MEGQGVGVLGGGYGAAQIAISGGSWFPTGWSGVQFLVVLAVLKIVAASMTIGTGGSAGDFAPSLAIGALLGGAFGRAAQLLVQDPRIDPGAFALVGMGAFYGGIAHVPLSALVLVCEMAGNYDLLVPLMLTLGISYVALRKHTLYEAQVGTQRDSPAFRDALMRDVLRDIRVREIMSAGAPGVTFAPGTSTPEMLHRTRTSTQFEIVPVLSADGKISGVVTPGNLRLLSEEKTDAGWALASDVMQAEVTVRPDADLRTAAELMAKALAGGPGGTDPTAVRGTASRLSRGPSATFERLLEGARERAAGSAMARVIEIALLMLLDRHDEAIGALQAARHDRSLAFVLLWAPTVDPLAGDPRFRHLFESSGLLLPRWRRS
jgi:CIC family chloride channel protein